MDQTQQQTMPDQLHFPPPPPNSGAGQNHSLPLSEAYTSNDREPVSHPPEQQAFLPPPPPGPPPAQTHSQSYVPANPAAQPVSHSDLYPHEHPPPMPPRPTEPVAASAGGLSHYDPTSYSSQQGSYVPPPPPQRIKNDFGDDDPSSPIHYARDPHKLIAYLVPFPKPHLKGVDPSAIPTRFLIYTPPPPPLGKPAEGEKEAKLHKVQRKWQEEVRSAKMSTAKTASWQGVKSKATRGISKAMGYTTNSNLDFLGRVSDHPKSDSEDDGHARDGVQEGDTTHRTVGVEEMLLVYPTTMSFSSQEEIRGEFVNTMLRAKTKAQRDAIISTGLMPVAYGIDILATLVWPFGGLGEIDTVWAYANIRGAKTARSVTKRLSSGSASNDHEQDKLRLNFVPSKRIEILRQYLEADCHKTDSKLFPGYSSAPTESDVLEAIGWSVSQSGGETKNWEDEQWETQEVREDLKLVMHKGAKEWNKWCKAFEKDPEKAMKK